MARERTASRPLNDVATPSDRRVGFCGQVRGGGFPGCPTPISARPGWVPSTAWRCPTMSGPVRAPRTRPECRYESNSTGVGELIGPRVPVPNVDQAIGHPRGQGSPVVLPRMSSSLRISVVVTTPTNIPPSTTGRRSTSTSSITVSASRTETVVPTIGKSVRM